MLNYVSSSKCKCVIFTVSISIITFLFLLLHSIHSGDDKICDSTWSSSVPTDEHSRSLTKIIHQSWKNKEIPERFKLYSKSWTMECFRDWKYMFWTDEDNLHLITNHYPWFLSKYNNFSSMIRRADVSRYFYLFHYGGIYTDLDNECLKPFEHLLEGFPLVFGAMKGYYLDAKLDVGYIQNSFMYSRPGHPFWMEVIYTILNNKKKGNAEFETGPVVLTNTIKRYKGTYHTNDLKIYAPNYFNPFSWVYKYESSAHCKTFDRMSTDDWKKCREYFIGKGSYVVQYHAHSWEKLR